MGGPIASSHRAQPANLLMQDGFGALLVDSAGGAADQLAKVGVDLAAVGAVILSHLARAPALRRVAAPREPPGRRPRAAPPDTRNASRDGAAGFAERARRELLATGATVRKRTVEVDRDLTAQELQIAVRARDGQTNTEIGVELFLSPRTVEWHLRKVFAKLGITSRCHADNEVRSLALPVGHQLRLVPL
jgi:DNA-binding CsgD family transcriptional regulator